MAAVKKEEKVVKEEKGINVIDVILDGWLNSFKTLQSFQTGVEQTSLQAFESQKEWIQVTREQFAKIEEQSKKLSTEWKENIQEALKKAQLDFGAENLNEWTSKLEEVSQKAETIVFDQSNATFEMLSKSHAELESALKKAIDQQQKNREEVLNTIGGYVDQFKQNQNEVLKALEQYNPLIAK